MKEATGELNMTVITVVAIAAVAALFYAFVWPVIQQSIATNSCTAAYGPDYAAKKENSVWKCCATKGTGTCVTLQ